MTVFQYISNVLNTWYCVTKMYSSSLAMVWSPIEYTCMNTPVLVDGEEVKPIILLFSGAKHGYLIVDKHPVQALIWDGAYTHIHTHTQLRLKKQCLFVSILQECKQSIHKTHLPRPYRAILEVPFCRRTGLISTFSTERE